MCLQHSQGCSVSPGHTFHTPTEGTFGMGSLYNGNVTWPRSPSHHRPRQSRVSKEPRLLGWLETGARKTTFALLLCCSLGGSLLCLPGQVCLCQQRERSSPWGRTSRWGLQWGPAPKHPTPPELLFPWDIIPHLYPLQALRMSQIKNTIMISASCGGTGFLPRFLLSYTDCE